LPQLVVLQVSQGLQSGQLARVVASFVLQVTTEHGCCPFLGVTSSEGVHRGCARC
jgi:hypothetical protein